MTEINLFLIAGLLIGFLVSIVLSVSCPLVFSILLIALNEKFFGMLPSRFGSDQLNLIPLSGVFLLFTAIIIQFIFFSKNYTGSLGNGLVKDGYLKFILMIIGVVIFCTIWGGYFINHQPVRSLILRPAPFFFYFIYVYLSFFLIDARQINQFLKIILFLSIGLVFTASIDAIFFGGTKLLSYSHTAERVGLVRKGVFTYGLILAYYFSLSKALDKSINVQKNSGYILCAAIILAFFFFVLVSRQVLISCMLATAVIFLTKGFLKTFALLIMSVFIMLFSYVQSDYDFSKTFIGKMYNLSEKEASVETSSIGVRIEGMKYYFQHFKKTYGIGFGLMSANPKYSNPISTGLIKYGYNLNDLSLSGIIFQFGFQAFILILLLVWKIIKDCQKLLKNSSVLSRPVINGIKYAMVHFTIVFPLTTVFFYKEKTIYFAIIFYLIDRMKYLTRSDNAVSGI